MFRVQDPFPFVRVYEGHGNRRAQVLMDCFILVCGTSGPLAVLLNDRAQQVAAGKGVQALALIPADAHPADTQLLGGIAAAETLQLAQPEHGGLPGWQLIQEALQQINLIAVAWLLWRFCSGHQIDQRFSACQRGIETFQLPGDGAAGPLLLAPRHADGAAQITGVME
jgi:hypothetical protein